MFVKNSKGSIYLKNAQKFLTICIGAIFIVSAQTYAYEPFYKLNTLKWLYIGWEEDHPKSWTFMGGAVGPGMAYKSVNKAKQGQIIQYIIQIDGTTYVPDEFSPLAKERIKWYYRDGYLPCPVSEWYGGHIKVVIQHFANRILNNSVTAVYSRVSLTNTGNCPTNVRLLINAASQYEVPITKAPSFTSVDSMYYDMPINANETVSVDFVAKANGTASYKELVSAGSFDYNYSAMSYHFNDRIENLAHPISLPVPEMVNMFKNLQILMWQSVVKTDVELQVRASAANPFGVMSYDCFFTHDIPNIVDQFMREGDYELAKKLLLSPHYKNLNTTELPGKNPTWDWYFRDQLGKYILPYAEYLQATGDRSFFTDEVTDDIKKAMINIHNSRRFDGKGHYGLFRPSSDFENHGINHSGDYLLADNWSALHGLQAYKNISDRLGDTEESKWAVSEMTDLNNCINKALEETAIRRKNDFYLGAFDDSTMIKYIVIGWVPFSAGLSTFPWGAYLKGYNLEGFWKDKYDKSLEYTRQELTKSGVPEASWGTWWEDQHYGSTYNSTAGIQCLFSEIYRTESIKNVEFLLNNQCAPFQWSEAFDYIKDDWASNTNPGNYGNWENWGCSFTKQCLMQSCVSVKSDNTVIIGRGIPSAWLGLNKKIEWVNVPVNNNKKINFKITSNSESVTLELSGDSPDGDIVFNLPVFVNNIFSSSEGSVNQELGSVTIKQDTKSVVIKLQRKLI